MRDDPTDDWEIFTTRLFDQSKFAIKLGLENIKKALECEGHPQEEWENIIVGGTNGKGQSASMLSNVLEDHGKKVGLFTSPHLIEFRERFRINGKVVSREEVLQVGKYVLQRYAKGKVCLSFFEMCVLIGLLIFKAHKIDVAILEVGLGGRLDAVNAVEPDLTVITNIGLDHEAYLGTRIEEIAAEKLALIRPHTPTIFAPQTYPDLLPQSCNTYYYAEKGNSFRASNANTAYLAAIQFLKKDFDAVIANKALKESHWPGRLELIEVKTGTVCFPLWLDAAHNPLGLKSCLDELSRDDFEVVIFGAMKDKNLEKMGELLADLNKAIWGVRPKSHRAAGKEELEKWMPIARFGALEDFLEESPRALVLGSIYLLGELFALIGREVEELRIRKNPKQW